MQPARIPDPAPAQPATRRIGRYDPFIDAVNRLPRPALMLLTVALFGYATLDPTGFAARMQALSAVPEPLWWMLGAVVTFYFGAREAHYHRQDKRADAGPQNADKAATPPDMP